MRCRDFRSFPGARGFLREQPKAFIQIHDGIDESKLAPDPGVGRLYAVYRMAVAGQYFSVEEQNGVSILRLATHDETNRLTRACVMSLTGAIQDLARAAR